METRLDGLARDFHYALRNLRKNPSFSLIAIFALALGIGATTVMFSVIYSAVVDALPYKNFDRSVIFKIRNLANVGGWKERGFLTPDEIRAFREQNHVFEETIAYNGIRLQYDDGKSIRCWPRGEIVTANTFDFLGVAPLLGRAFSREDARPDAPPVFVMNYHFWQSEFGGDPKILNKIFILNGKPTMLVGIMPQRFNAFSANFWLPMSDGQGDASVMGRLKPGASAGCRSRSRCHCTWLAESESRRAISTSGKIRDCAANSARQSYRRIQEDTIRFAYRCLAFAPHRL